VAKAHHVPLHLDCARLFNASEATWLPVKAFADQTDTVQICLSKGLGAPVGSIIAGSESFIDRARKWRKRLGGGLRQAGMIAAPGYIALTEMTERLKDDHHLAQLLKKGLEEIEGLSLEKDVDTNILMRNIKNSGNEAPPFLAALKSKGILASAFGPHTLRLTTHYDVSASDIETVLTTISEISSGVRTHGV
jgi:threonine aldolase